MQYNEVPSQGVFFISNLIYCVSIQIFHRQYFWRFSLCDTLITHFVLDLDLQIDIRSYVWNVNATPGRLQRLWFSDLHYLSPSPVFGHVYRFRMLLLQL